MNQLKTVALRRQVLDWRDKWMFVIPVKLDRELPMLISLIDVKIEQMSFREAFATQKFAAKHLQPTYESWIHRKSNELIDQAQADLKSINEEILEHSVAIHQIAQDTSGDNYVAAGIAGGSASAALLGVPAIAAISTTSAGGILGLVGLTVISWPVVLGGALVLGSVFVFGGKKAFGLRDKAVKDYKQKTRDMLHRVVLLNDEGDPSVAAGLQDCIKRTSDAYLQELKHVQQHSL